MTRDGALQATYSYDANGNRTQVTRAGELPITAAYDAQDRLIALRRGAYTYTAAGELKTKVVGADVTRLRLRRARRADEGHAARRRGRSST